MTSLTRGGFEGENHPPGKLVQVRRPERRRIAERFAKAPRHEGQKGHVANRH